MGKWQATFTADVDGFETKDRKLYSMVMVYDASSEDDALQVTDMVRRDLVLPAEIYQVTVERVN